MKLGRQLTVFAFLFTLLIFSANMVKAIPSGGVYPPEFNYKNGYWYDSWDYNRNNYAGEDGFLPNVAFESLGSDKELAYELGEWFKKNYNNKVERAEAILNYVQKWTDYGYDEDNVFRNGVAQEEWAWNADEMAHMFDVTTYTVAVGDCEDLAFLCSTLYIASDFDVALIDAPGHVALLIWLPEYDNANYYWDIPDDGRDYGWIWVEATSEVNPIGWTPPDFSDGDWISYTLDFYKLRIDYSPRNPKADDDVKVMATIENEISAINAVILTYTIGANSKEVEMIKKISYYEAVIPKQLDGTKVLCEVTVTDYEGFSSEQKFEYIVGQEFQFPPFLSEAVVTLFIIFLLLMVLARYNS